MHESCPSETNYDKFICEYEVQEEIDSFFGVDKSQMRMKKMNKKTCISSTPVGEFMNGML